MSRSLPRDGRRRITVITVTMTLIAVALGLPAAAVAATVPASHASGAVRSPAATKASEKVIIRFKTKPGRAEKAAINAAGGHVTHDLRLIDGLAVTMPAAAVAGLRKNPHVTSIEHDGTIVAFADPPTGDLEYDNAWGVHHIGTYPVHQAGIRGAGIKVAVIDTGIDYIHDQPPSAEPPVVDPEFSLNYRGGYDFYNNDTDPMDDNGHGTHVAGILAAEKNGYLVVGVAPAVDLYALKVLGAGGSGDYSGLIAALGWAVDHHIDVVNISLGGHDVSASLQAAVTAAYNGGVTIVAASGNVVTFQDLLYGCPVAYPAAYPEVIAVSFTGSTDQLTGYSCTGPQVDLAAPGDQIPSTVPVGSCQFCSPNGYAFLSGTSMASPHVAGVVALVLSAGIADSNGNGLLADDVRAHLCATAATATYPAKTDARYPKWYGCGIVDADNALLNVPPPGSGGLNHAPVAAADNAATTEDAGPLTIDVLANDTDQDPGTTLTVTAVTDAPNGTAAIGPGGANVTYAPDPNANGTDTFSYTVSDGARTASATVTVSVAAVNDPPVAVDDTLATLLNTVANLAVLANDSDIDGGSLSVVGVTVPDHGSATIEAGGSVIYTPATGYSGPDGFDYTVSDGAGGTDVGHVSVTVLAVDRPPIAVDDSLTTAEDTAASVAVLANDTDPDNETLTTAAITRQPAHGTASITAGGAVLYTPTANYNGPDSFSYRVADGAGLTDIGDVLVAVTPVNDPPTAANDTASTPEDQPVTIAVLANDGDIDGDALSVAVTAPGVGSAAANADGTITYTPPLNEYGDDTFGYTVSDGAGGTASASVTVSISPVNDPPTAAPKTVSTPYATAVTISMTGADVETCDLNFQIVTGPTHGSLGAISNQLCVTLLPPYSDSAKVTYTPANGYKGPDSFTYRTSDGSATSPTVTVSITVAPQILLHVGDLDGSKKAGTSWTATVSILVHNVADAPFSGVTVNGTWSTGATGAVSCRSAATGLCSVTKTGIVNTTASVTFSITSLVLTKAAYVPASNHDPDGDSTGTVIVVSKP
ncbi:MAG: Ig-like domain-containing protein [Chloroflexota bacterium]